jgi:hypothetical protein
LTSLGGSSTLRQGGGEIMRSVRYVKVTLAVGVALLLGVAAITLTHAPPSVVGASNATNAVTKRPLARTLGDATVCQGNEALPAATSAIRVTLGAEYGSRVEVKASRGSRILTQGARGPEWTSGSVTVPVAPLSHAVSQVTLCFTLSPNSEPIYFLGNETPARETAILHLQGSPAGQPLGGRVDVEYLAAGRGSWWSRILTVARHMGLGRALSGTWVVLLIAALVAAVGVLALGLALRDSGRSAALPDATMSGPASGAYGTVRAALARLPVAAWACALVALLNASAWSLIVPPFQGRDEADHFAYVEQLAETGTLPDDGHENGTYSPQEKLVLRGLHYGEVVRSPQTPSISSTAEQRALERDASAGASLRGSGEAGSATSEPPLYYAIQTIPYALARGNILAQLQLMRLVGALFGAVTAMLAFLFLRELLPGAPWAATIGALCVALQPLFAFVSGSLNPDSMLFAVAAGIFLCLARAFRRRLTRRLAIVLGALIAVGFLTKLNFVGFAFGVFFGVAVLALREGRSRGRTGLLLAAIAAGIGIAPVMVYGLRNVLTNRPTLGIVSGSLGSIPMKSLGDEAGYIWQVYLPRLPGMTHYFSGLATYKDIWFDRSVGLYGWIDTMFPVWVDDLALVFAVVIASLCVREMVLRRAALRARLAEAGVYAAIVLGVLVMIGASSYLSDVVQHDHAFGEPRYLLPLLPLLGAVVALAVRGAGRRWAPVAGAALVVLFLGHDIFSQLQVIARYYG